MTDAFLAWTALLAVAHFALGVMLGLAYFRSLWWIAGLLASGAPSRTAAWMAGRLVVLAGVLALISAGGAVPLLATALGVLAGRNVVLHRVRAAAH